MKKKIKAWIIENKLCIEDVEKGIGLNLYIGDLLFTAKHAKEWKEGKNDLRILPVEIHYSLKRKV